VVNRNRLSLGRIVSSCEQIFTLREIIRLLEKVKGRDKSVYLNFVDCRKAFDSIHRDTLDNIMYSISDKILNTIKSF